MTQRASCWFYGRNSFRCDGLSSRGHVRCESPTELSLRAGRVCRPCACLTASVTRSAFRPTEKGITTSSTSYVPPHICQNSKPSSWVREPPHFHTGSQHNSNPNTFAHWRFLSRHSLRFWREGCTDDFHCANQGQSRLIDGVDDAREMCNTRKAFSLLGDCCVLHSKATQQASHSLLHCRVTKCAPVHLLSDLFSFIVGINESVQMALYQILAAILHLSNVEVKDQSGDRSSILVKKNNNGK